ncbi:hypothetical protein BN3662_01974 [Clostridiales bacterium CHKCI006]|nr:hypothetical protein BN3662_01974 [Clostridiales bacterium CHKCI006]
MKWVNVMVYRVKLFDEEHELDLEDAINDFLDELEGEVIHIHYQVALCLNGNEMEYCYSALIEYLCKDE